MRVRAIEAFDRSAPRCRAPLASIHDRLSLNG